MEIVTDMNDRIWKRVRAEDGNLSRRTERHENENVRLILIKGKIFYQEKIKLKNNHRPYLFVELI